jgi:hypothetical protein
VSCCCCGRCCLLICVLRIWAKLLKCNTTEELCQGIKAIQLDRCCISVTVKTEPGEASATVETTSSECSVQGLMSFGCPAGTSNVFEVGSICLATEAALLEKAVFGA